MPGRDAYLDGLLGMVIAATASGGVVLSLIDRPAGQTSVVAHTSAPYVQAAPTPVGAPETGPAGRSSVIGSPKVWSRN